MDLMNLAGMTLLILTGNRTQVTFSGLIPLDHQDTVKILYVLSIQFEWKKTILLISYIWRCKTRKFSGQGGFLKSGHFDKHFLKKSRETALQWKILGLFVVDTLKLSQDGPKSGPFFQNQGIFLIFKEE